MYLARYARHQSHDPVPRERYPVGAPPPVLNYYVPIPLTGHDADNHDAPLNPTIDPDNTQYLGRLNDSDGCRPDNLIILPHDYGDTLEKFPRAIATAKHNNMPQYNNYHSYHNYYYNTDPERYNKDPKR